MLDELRQLPRKHMAVPPNLRGLLNPVLKTAAKRLCNTTEGSPLGAGQYPEGPHTPARNSPMLY